MTCNIDKKINVIFIKGENCFSLPKRITEGSAGMDIYSNENCIIQPMERKIVGTGFSMEIPLGYHGEIRSRSGLALKKGITTLNSPGTIDSDYREEINVILINLSKEEVHITRGERISQLVISKHEYCKSENNTHFEIRDGGFGSTGNK
jgi:dUTP pyrophosphatase